MRLPQPATRHQVGERGVGSLAGQAQQGDLAGVLDLAQRLDGSGGLHQLGGRLPVVQLAGQGVESVDGHHIAFEAQLSGARLGRLADQIAPQRAFDGDVHVRRLLGGLGAVPAVGRQHGDAVVGEHQQRAVRPGESGEITDIDQVRDQQGIQSAGLEPRSEPVSTL